MGVRGDEIKKHEARTRESVIIRDNWRCFICGDKASEIHEIISRNRWGSKEMAVCFHPKNRICICRPCHDLVQGKRLAMMLLFRMLTKMYGYQYTEPQFTEYT